MAGAINGPLHAQREGLSGDVMLFVHPNPYDHTAWLYQLAHFASWYRCIAVDLPGFGRSPAAQRGLRLNDLADACWDVVDTVERDAGAILVGCSIGCPIVARMQRLRPHRTKAVVLSGTGAWVSRDYQEMLRALIADYEREGVGYRRRFAIRDLSPTFRASPIGQFIVDQLLERDPYVDVPTVQLELQSLIDEGAQDFYSSIDCPKVILTGTEDGSHERAVVLALETPNLEIGILPGAGHACQLEQPWLFDRMLLEFLARHGLAPVAQGQTGVLVRS